MVAGLYEPSRAALSLQIRTQLVTAENVVLEGRLWWHGGFGELSTMALMHSKNPVLYFYNSLFFKVYSCLRHSFVFTWMQDVLQISQSGQVCTFYHILDCVLQGFVSIHTSVPISDRFGKAWTFTLATVRLCLASVCVKESGSLEAKKKKQDS